MTFTHPVWAMKRLPTLACILFAALTPWVAADGETATVECRFESGAAVGPGLEHQGKNVESEHSFVERDGRKAVREKKMLYMKVTDPRLTKGKTPQVSFVLDYFDEGDGLVVLKYDSSDSNIGTGDKRGVWKAKRALMLTGTGEWKTAKFTVPDAWFDGRCNGGDFRFEGRGGLTLSKITLTAADGAAQAANRLALANAPAPIPVVPFTMSMEEVWARGERFKGPSKKGTDPSTLTGKVMCGYQGWHGVPNDGSGLGWVHWGEHGSFEPGDCHVEYWPDMSEASADEKTATPFRKADGSVAHVYTGMSGKTVDRHFQWMEEAGIDGVFLQRFASGVTAPNRTFKNNTVLSHVRAGANAHGRTWALMYDLSGYKNADALVADWKRLVDHYGVGKDPAYQRHKGKPVLAIWGLFGNRPECFESFERLMDLAQNDPVYGGFAIKLGTDNSWRSGTSSNYDRLRQMVARAEIISPWAVGRYGNPEQAEVFVQLVQAPDIKWCRENGKDYMPVIFPGFSWHNMHDGSTALDAIPRLEGRFLWGQAVANRKAGADMLYVAMFDEIDEGTAIYKVDPNPPVQPDETTRFLSYGKLPTDYYLWLTGQAKGLLTGAIPLSPLPPARPGLKVDYSPRFTNGLPAGVRELAMVMSGKGQSKGLIVSPKGSEVRTAPVARDGREGWLVKALPGSEKLRKLYVKVDHGDFRGLTAPAVAIEVDLYSPQATTVKMVYDSRDFSWQPQGTSPGAWKEAGILSVPGGGWTTRRLELKDPLFVGRCNGADIRLEIDGNAEVVVGAIRMKRLD